MGQNITFADKDNFKLEPSIPANKKVTKDDMNQIKSVVNNNNSVKLEEVTSDSTLSGVGTTLDPLVVENSPKLGGELPAEYKLFSTLTDKDRADQDISALGNLTGSVPLDMGRSWLEGTATGNITISAFSNNPASTKRRNVKLTIKQDATGGRTITFVGSGAIPEEGKTDTDYQLKPEPNAITNYWFSWTGTAWEISKDSREITPL